MKSTIRACLSSFFFCMILLHSPTYFTDTDLVYAAELETENMTESNSAINSGDDIYHFDIYFGGRSTNAIRAHYDNYYYIDYEHKIMIKHTTGRDHGKKVNYVSAFFLNITEKEDTKILNWNDYTGTVSAAHIEIIGDKVYWYDIRGELSNTYTASSVIPDDLESLSSAENFDDYCTPSIASGKK